MKAELELFPAVLDDRAVSAVIRFIRFIRFTVSS